MAQRFQAAFGRSVTVIIDSFEIVCERPSSLLPRAQIFSNYNHSSTGKFLLGCTPQGTVSFISECWVGRTSELKILMNCRFLFTIFTCTVFVLRRRD